MYASEDGSQRPHWRDWPRENIRRICRLVDVPEVGAHSMRGLHSALAFERGAVGNLVAESLLHTDESITKTSYAKKGAVRRGEQKRALQVLTGGKS